MTELRIETDSLGSIEVPSSVLWGAQTQRSLMNFQIYLKKIMIENKKPKKNPPASKTSKILLTKGNSSSVAIPRSGK